MCLQVYHELDDIILGSQTATLDPNCKVATISSHKNYNFESSQGWITPAAFQQVLILHVPVSSQKFHFYEFLMMQSNFFKVTERLSSYSDIKFAHSFWQLCKKASKDGVWWQLGEGRMTG